MISIRKKLIAANVTVVTLVAVAKSENVRNNTKLPATWLIASVNENISKAHGDITVNTNQLSTIRLSRIIPMKAQHRFCDRRKLKKRK